MSASHLRLLRLLACRGVARGVGGWDGGPSPSGREWNEGLLQAGCATGGRGSPPSGKARPEPPGGVARGVGGGDGGPPPSASGEARLEASSPARVAGAGQRPPPNGNRGRGPG